MSEEFLEKIQFASSDLKKKYYSFFAIWNIQNNIMTNFNECIETSF